MCAAAISIESVSKSYADERVLRNIDLEISEGEFCVIVGPSGCGKTTLLDCIAGLTPLDTGKVSFSGREVTKTPVEDRGVGYVFQDFEETLFPHRTVAENIAFGINQGNRDLSEEEIDNLIDEVLDLLAISETKHTQPSELSGGQQQRVELARQLVRDCTLMLFDDPLADLDYKLEKRMQLEMRRIHRDREETFVYVTHNQDQAFDLADRLIVMNEGVIEQAGTAVEIYTAPQNAFVGRFVGDSNPIVGEVINAGDPEVTLDTPLGQIKATGVGGTFEMGFESIAIVRPEQVSLGEQAETKTNRVEAKLEGLTYMGDATELTFSIDGWAEDFIVTKPGRTVVGQTGDRLTLGWDTSQCLFFHSMSASGEETINELMEM